jgi:hypothetical protein
MQRQRRAESVERDAVVRDEDVLDHVLAVHRARLARGNAVSLCQKVTVRAARLVRKSLRNGSQ